MPRLLQVNTAGAWKNVQTIRCRQTDSDGDLADAKAAVVLLAVTTDEQVSWRIVDRRPGAEDEVIARWDRKSGWRSRS